MLVEGLAEFHRRSVWHFRHSVVSNHIDIVFPLITPALLREHHMYIRTSGISPENYTLGVDEYPGQGTTETFVFNIRPHDMSLVNLMMTAGEAYANIHTIQIDLDVRNSEFVHWSEEPQAYVNEGLFDFSRLDRLARYRHLKKLDVRVVLAYDCHVAEAARIENIMDNLITELKIVGQALVPGGQATKQFPQAG
jgi:hypothetical protein